MHGQHDGRSTPCDFHENSTAERTVFDGIVNEIVKKSFQKHLIPIEQGNIGLKSNVEMEVPKSFFEKTDASGY